MSTLREVLAEAGFKGDALDTAVGVAMAESGGRPTAHNPNAGTGDNSFGLFQINMLGNLGPARLKQYGLTSYDQLYDPRVNARIAYQMSNGGTNWQPWTTYTRGTYKQYVHSDPPLGGTGGVGAAGGEDGSGGTDSGTGARTTTTDTHPVDPTSTFDIGTGSRLSSILPSADEHAAEVAYLLGEPAPAVIPATPVPTTTTPTVTGTDAAVQKFVNAAVAQRGDAWVFGAKGTGQADPTAFDCSGLTQWAAHQAGGKLNAGAAGQYLQLKQAHMLIPVDQAIHTPGALLFHFASEPQPGAGEPPVAHVAISLGNGMTIEAANPKDGVDEFTAKGRFEYAAIIPGIGTLPTTAPTKLVDLSSAHDASGLIDLSDLGDGTDSGLDDGLPLTGHFSGTGTGNGLGSGSGIGSLIDGDDSTHGGPHGGLDFDFH